MGELGLTPREDQGLRIPPSFCLGTPTSTTTLGSFVDDCVDAREKVELAGFGVTIELTVVGVSGTLLQTEPRPSGSGLLRLTPTASLRARLG